MAWIILKLMRGAGGGPGLGDAKGQIRRQHLTSNMRQITERGTVMLSGNGFVTDITLLGSTTAVLFGGITAGLSFVEKARDLRRLQKERRQSEILRLLSMLQKNLDTFSNIFDYASSLDEHLRTTDLVFSKEEVSTRSTVDVAFEHLRDVHRSVHLRLLHKTDLAPWVYWIHRIQTRAPICKYAAACGYYAFLDDLQAWTKSSKELQQLKANCPWWLREGREPVGR
jgi:hypothetical protein